MRVTTADSGIPFKIRLVITFTSLIGKWPEVEKVLDPMPDFSQTVRLKNQERYNQQTEYYVLHR